MTDKQSSNEGLAECLIGFVFFIYLLNVLDLKVFGYAVIVALIALFFYSLIFSFIAGYAAKQFMLWMKDEPVEKGWQLKWTFIGLFICLGIFLVLPMK